MIVAGLMLASVCASAQNYFGVTGGCNLSHIHDKDFFDVDYYNKIGFNVGVAYEHRFKNSGNNYPFIDASILYSLEQYSFAYKDRTIDPYDMVLTSGSFESIVKEKYLKVPVGVGFNFQLTDKFGIAPKIFGIFDADMSGPPSSGSDKFFAFGGGANFNIGERFSIGVGYDFRRDIYGFADEYILFDNYHANLTYYIFSK